MFIIECVHHWRSEFCCSIRSLLLHYIKSFYYRFRFGISLLILEAERTWCLPRYTYVAPMTPTKETSDLLAALSTHWSLSGDHGEGPPLPGIYQSSTHSLEQPPISDSTPPIAGYSLGSMDDENTCSWKDLGERPSSAFGPGSPARQGVRHE
jgi:hypothetical protein